MGRHQLALTGHDFPGGRHADRAGINTLAALRPPFEHAEDDRDCVASCSVPDRVQMARGQTHGLIDIVCVQVFLKDIVEPRPIGALDPERIAGHQRLTKGHEFGTGNGSFIDGFDHARKRGLTVQPDRRNLGRGDAQPATHRIPSR